MTGAVPNANGLTKKVDWTSIDTQIEHKGKKITLPDTPAPMPYDDAIRTLERVREQENQEFDVRELIAGAPWDAAVAVYRAMQDIYGVVLSKSQRTWFGEIRPDFLTVITGHRDEDRVQVPVGQVQLPNVSEPVHVALVPDGVQLYGTVRKRDRAILVEIANRARAFLRTQSVYKGKAISFHVDDDGGLELSQQPTFLDLSTVQETDIIHTAETEALIRTNIFAPLRHTEACRANKIPLKRGILLEGRYGTGKSLTARVTAKVAVDNGWTFIVLNRSCGLKAAIEFARTYQPCVIFAEDIDRAADREDEDVNELVNLLDGLITKDMEMMVVLTTNFVEKIDKALLRPGRFDAVISIQSPDAETAIRLVRAYARDLLPADTNLNGTGELIAGAIPATIREIVERAKLAMLTEGRNTLTAEDLHIAAIGMRRHLELLDEPKQDKSYADLFTEGLIGLLGKGIETSIDAASAEQLMSARNAIIRRVNNVRDVTRQMGVVVTAGAAAATAAADNSGKALDLLSKSGGGRKAK